MMSITALSEAKRSLLESYLATGAGRSRVAPSVITAKSSGEPAPLTMSQEQLILREIRRPDAPRLYNECIQLRMLGPLNIAALRKSFCEILRRHDIWRTT